MHGEVLGFASGAGEGVMVAQQEPARLAARLAGTVEAVVDEGGAPDVVSLHGDGGSPADVAEALALKKVLGERVGGTALLLWLLFGGKLGGLAGFGRGQRGPEHATSQVAARRPIIRTRANDRVEVDGERVDCTEWIHDRNEALSSISKRRSIFLQGSLLSQRQRSAVWRRDSNTAA